MDKTNYHLDNLHDFIGKNVGVSDWFPVDQERMNAFADITCNHDWMHIDPERAKKEGPFDGTVAFGFWTLSMLTYFSYQIGLWPEGIAYGVNYGLNKVRWIAPVPVGSHIRNRVVLTGVEDKGNGHYLITTTNTVEVEGADKPAMVAEWLGMLVRQ
ncbi:MAG: MaoC family dehydratase [Alphaproteobacteria bacterium]